MSIVFNKVITHNAPGVLLGDRGDDEWEFTIPDGEEYDKSEIQAWFQMQSFDISVVEEPRQGQTGTLKIKIHWWMNGFVSPGFFPYSQIGYTLNVFSRQATLVGEPGRILLFENINFDGRFKEIRNGNADLTFNDDGFFNEKISSIVVLSGNWSLFKNINFNGPYLFNTQSIVLEPGMYADIRNLDIPNDDLSSLLCVAQPPNHI